jgi:hypothetical protein
MSIALFFVGMALAYVAFRLYVTNMEVPPGAEIAEDEQIVHYVQPFQGNSI